MASVCRFHRLTFFNYSLRQFSKLRNTTAKQIKCSSYTSRLSDIKPWTSQHVIRSFTDSIKSRSSSARKPTNGVKRSNVVDGRPSDAKLTLDEELAKLGLYQRYKKLALEYWYVLLPVHAGLSCAWFGSCYLFARRYL